MPGSGNGFGPRHPNAHVWVRVDDNDLSPYPLNRTPAGAEQSARSTHIQRHRVRGNDPLDANQQVIQDELLSTIGSFAANGNPEGQGDSGLAAVQSHATRCCRCSQPVTAS